jgi:hypothetical protein
MSRQRWDSMKSISRSCSSTVWLTRVCERHTWINGAPKQSAPIRNANTVVIMNCSRLPYGVVVNVSCGSGNVPLKHAAHPCRVMHVPTSAAPATHGAPCKHARLKSAKPMPVSRYSAQPSHAPARAVTAASYSEPRRAAIPQQEAA